VLAIPSARFNAPSAAHTYGIEGRSNNSVFAKLRVFVFRGPEQPSAFRVDPIFLDKLDCSHTGAPFLVLRSYFIIYGQTPLGARMARGPKDEKLPTDVIGNAVH
jgi:hypothetical protein